jgi:hypothetical protein
LPSLDLGLRVDQVRDTLGPGKIELSILDRAAREFPRLGGPQSLSDQSVCQAGQHGATSVHVEFSDVFARVTSGCWEQQYEPLINNAFIREERTKSSHARRGQAAMCDLLERHPDPRP